MIPGTTGEWKRGRRNEHRECVYHPDGGRRVMRRSDTPLYCRCGQCKRRGSTCAAVTGDEAQRCLLDCVGSVADHRPSGKTTRCRRMSWQFGSDDATERVDKALRLRRGKEPSGGVGTALVQALNGRPPAALIHMANLVTKSILELCAEALSRLHALEKTSVGASPRFVRHRSAGYRSSTPSSQPEFSKPMRWRSLHLIGPAGTYPRLRALARSARKPRKSCPRASRLCAGLRLGSGGRLGRV